MPRPTKKQINIKMPEALIEKLKARAELENDTFTDLVIRFCEQGLGSKSDRPITVTEVTPTQLNKRIAEQLAPLQERLEALETELMGELRA